MNFAPYQDENPETERAFSPPPQERARSPLIRSPPRSPPPGRAFSPSALPPPDVFGDGNTESRGIDARLGRGDVEEARPGLNAFETSLPIRLDYEAMLAYLLLPPAGGVFLLLMEHKSDYVRFHAWQSSMLFTVVFIIHLIFSWSRFLSWFIFAGDLLLIGFLSWHAYHDVDTLDHFEVPFFGRLANSFVDDE